MGTNNGKTWTVTEVSKDELPPVDGGGVWWPLYQDIVLRLEQTNDNFALKIDLPAGGAAAGKAAISRYAKQRKGKGAIILRSVVHADGSGTLFATRGPNWSK